MQAFSDLEIPQRTVRCDCVLHPGETHVVVGADRHARRIESLIYDAGTLLPSRNDAILYAEVRRWSYKPNWWLWIEGGSHDGWSATLYLRALARVPNSYDPSTVIEISAKYAVPHALREDPLEHIASGHFAIWFMDSIRSMEDHEMREWLKRDGVLHDDPHATEKARG
jgi:hypothetical protein